MYRTTILAALTLTAAVSLAAQDNEQQLDSRAASILEKATLVMAPSGQLDELRSLEYRGRSNSLDRNDANDDGAAQTEMLMLFPEDTPRQLFMHSRHRTPKGDTFIRTLTGDRSSAGKIGLLPPDLHRDFVRYASTKLLTILRFRNSPELTAEVIGSESIDGEDVDLVEVELFGFKSVLEVARESGHVLAVRFSSSEIQEGVGDKQVRRAYSDLRSVDSFYLPFLQTVTVGGEPYSKWELDEIVVNGEYDAAIFDLGD